MSGNRRLLLWPAYKGPSGECWPCFLEHLQFQLKSFLVQTIARVRRLRYQKLLMNNVPGIDAFIHKVQSRAVRRSIQQGPYRIMPAAVKGQVRWMEVEHTVVGSGKHRGRIDQRKVDGENIIEI